MGVKLSLHEAVTQIIMSKFNTSFISVYQLSLIIFDLVQKKELNGKELKVKVNHAQKSHLIRTLNKLEEEGILTKVPGLSNHILAFQPLFRKEKGNAIKLISETDPFLYVSHLSAMVYHGLTDRLPTTVFCTSLNENEWSKKAKIKMMKDLKDSYNDYCMFTDLPKMRRVRFDKGRFLGKPLELFKISNIDGAYTFYEDGTRVATIGRTFRDMLKKPTLCGGMQHVKAVFEEYAHIYLELIINELDLHGSKIEKARAGYLLEEICDLHNPKINLWLDTVQRGGSRKLDPQSPFDPMYSERWSLSINA